MYVSVSTCIYFKFAAASDEAVGDNWDGYRSYSSSSSKQSRYCFNRPQQDSVEAVTIVGTSIDVIARSVRPTRPETGPVTGPVMTRRRAHGQEEGREGGMEGAVILTWLTTQSLRLLADSEGMGTWQTPGMGTWQTPRQVWQ